MRFKNFPLQVKLSIIGFLGSPFVASILFFLSKGDKTMAVFHVLLIGCALTTLMVSAFVRGRKWPEWLVLYACVIPLSILIMRSVAQEEYDMAVGFFVLMAPLLLLFFMMHCKVTRIWREAQRTLVPTQKGVCWGDAINRFIKGWTFRGRASRSEYWNIYLLTTIFEMCCGVLSAMLPLLIPIMPIIALVLAWPYVCLTVRRFHDVGLSSGWLIGIGFLMLVGVVASFGFGLEWGSIICLVGIVFILVVTLMPSCSHVNRYGQIPELVDSNSESMVRS